MEESLAAASQGQQAAHPPPDLDRARLALVTCQRQFNHLAHRCSSDLMHYERMAELASVGQERGGKWRAWANRVKATLDSCQQPMFDVNEALFQCWQEVVERIGLTAVSVQATSIGQLVTVPEGQDQARERVT